MVQKYNDVIKIEKMEKETISEHIKTFIRIRPDLPEDSQGENDTYLTGKKVFTTRMISLLF